MSNSVAGSQYVYNSLVNAGIKHVIGLPGTQTLPLDRTVVQRDEMDYVMARHETAVPHIAWGYFESSGQVAATLTIPGPGDTNAMHGLKNALEDSVPIVHISADINPADYGKKPIHEIEPETFDHVVKKNLNVERPANLRSKVADGIETATTPPYGPVRLGIPSNILATEFFAPPVTVSPQTRTADNTTGIERATRALAAAEKPVVYIGGGTRRSPNGPRIARELVTELNAPVVASLKGKGVFPEDEPQFMGITGSHLAAGARRVLDTADTVLALGTDFDGVTTADWSISMGETLIHVNLDPNEIDSAYESDIPIVADAGEASKAILDGLTDTDRRTTAWDGAEVAATIRREYFEQLRDQGLFADTMPINTPNVLTTVREELPRETIVTTDVGGFRLWAKQVFETYRPDQYITAGSWAGMGVGLPAAIGAALANPDRPVACLTGDGGLLMCIHELHTAADYDLDITLVVSNNEDYGSISKSPKIEQYTDGHQFTWESPSYVTIAEGFGWDGMAANTAEELSDAVATAISRDGPMLIDVSVPTEEPSASAAADYESTVDIL